MFVHSWCLDKFERSAGTLGIIRGKLSDLGFQMPKTPPKEEYIKFVERLLDIFKKQQDRDEVPWIFVISDTTDFLLTCARILPVSFAFSTARSVFSTDVDNMMRVFMARQPEDDFELFPAGETTYDMKTAGLLVINNITEKAAGASKNTGKFSSLLMERAGNKLPTIFTAHSGYELNMEVIQKNLNTQIAQTLGGTVSGMIQEYSEYVRIKRKEKPKKMQDIII